MIFVYLGLFFAEWFAVALLFAPFGVLALAELVRAARLPGTEGVPRDRPPNAPIARWHLFAAFLIVGSSVAIMMNLTCDVLSGGSCSTDSLFLVALEATLWFMTSAVLFAPFYAVRLYRQRVHAAELIGLGVFLLPASLWMTTIFFRDGYSQGLLASGVTGAVLFLSGLVIPIKVVKPLFLASSCALMIFTVTEIVGPANPAWLLAVFSIGYVVFRAEWKLRARPQRAAVQYVDAPSAEYQAAAKSEHGTRNAATVRTATFLIVNAVCIAALLLVWRIAFDQESSAPASFSALIGIAIAVVGALLTAFVPLAFGRAHADLDHAAATFVVLLACASVLHLFGAPRVEGFDLSTSEWTQLWKPVLSVFACLGALGIALTTLTGRVCQIRPFLLAIVVPAAFMLPTGSFFNLMPDEPTAGWIEGVIETGITMTILALMWYVFGPGRRRESEQSNAPPNASGDLDLVENPAG